MRLKSKDKNLVKHIHILYRKKYYYEMCNEIWYYGEFDFFYDYCRHLRYRFKSEWYRHWYYGGVANIFFSEHYNVRLMFINQGEPRKDDYLVLPFYH